MDIIDLTEDDNETTQTMAPTARNRPNRKRTNDDDEETSSLSPKPGTTAVRRSKRQQRLRHVISETQDEKNISIGDDEEVDSFDEETGGIKAEDIATVSSNDDDDGQDEDDHKCEEELRSPSPIISSVSSIATSATTMPPSLTTAGVTTTNATSSSAAKASVTPAKMEAYLRERRRAITTRTFDLSLIPPSEIFPTGRTIKKMPGWTGHWPAIRELMQNTIDHLGLLDPRTGRRHAALHLRVTTENDGDEVVVIHQFCCKDEPICTIRTKRDSLVIEQLYTYPLPSRALDTGVTDETKFNSTSTAGGFGDGFKTAALALHSLGENRFDSMTWTFDARKEKRRIVWFFESDEREAVGRFSKSRVLRVRIENTENNSTASLDDDGNKMGRAYIMTQTVKAKDIGKSFLIEAVPRLQIFWDVDESTIIGTSTSGGDYIAPALLQPPIPGTDASSLTSMMPSPASSSTRRRKKATSPLFPGNDNIRQPEAGIYVRGIWVRKPPIPDTLMCFFGSRLQVSGRDRNDVHEEELVDAVAHVIRKCNNLERLRGLLEPLRGIRSSSSSIDDDTRERRSKRHTMGNKGQNDWLLKSPRFLNQLWMIEKHRNYVLHNVLQIPQNAIFVSSRTTKSSDPFLRWASDFLQKKGAPLAPIEPGANRYLFEEVSEAELTDRCVRILNDDLKQNNNKKADDDARNLETLQVAFRKILSFMGTGSGRKVIFSPDVTVAFVHNNRYLFVPEALLTRELLVKVLNVCQCHLDGANGEKYSCLVQALFESLPGGRTRALNVEDVEKVIERARQVKKENANFLAQSRGKNFAGSRRTGESERPKVPEKESANEVMDLTESPTRSSCGGKSGRCDRSRIVTPSVDLEAQIARITRTVGRKRRNTYGVDDDGLDSIIPEANFGSDDAGTDTCLRSSSALQCINVDDSLGGGSLLCDERTISDLRNNAWSSSAKTQLAALRQLLDESIDVVRRCTPSLSPLLSRVRHGYDSNNDTYEAFCDGKRIVVNLYTYMPRLPTTAPCVAAALATAPKTLLHDFIVTVTHEIAHFLQPGAGHGPEWRDSHMAMLVEVMAMLELKELPTTSSSSS
mmetsp:Transcript_33108/g.50043  ORF Transcript_33108/g.50043 Transcript_33108/m.50043 type:complete len:1085 (+) Transcript_33108:339-3593(+)